MPEQLCMNPASPEIGTFLILRWSASDHVSRKSTSAFRALQASGRFAAGWPHSGQKLGQLVPAEMASYSAILPTGANPRQDGRGLVVSRACWKFNHRGLSIPRSRSPIVRRPYWALYSVVAEKVHERLSSVRLIRSAKSGQLLRRCLEVGEPPLTQLALPNGLDLIDGGDVQFNDMPPAFCVVCLSPPSRWRSR